MSSILIALVSSLCNFSDLKISDETKLTCIDYYVNCSITSDKQATTAIIMKCKEKRK